MRHEPNSPPLAPADWLLAETTRRLEESNNRFVLDDPATLGARNLNAPMSQKIVARARARSEGQSLARATRRALRLINGLGLLLLLCGLLAGAAAAAAVQTAPGTIALSYALAAMLGVPLALLLVWVLVALLAGRGKRRAGVPGKLLWQAVLALVRRLGGAPRRQLAAALAGLGRERGMVIAAVATHGFWAAYFVGALGWLWLRFLGLRFDFSWETTLLAGDAMAGVIGAIGVLPHALLGLNLPGPEQIQAVLGGRSAPADRALWANWLLATIAMYGLAPRLLLAIAFVWRWKRTRLALDLAQPGYLRVLPALGGESAGSGGRQGPAPMPDRIEFRRAVPGNGRPVRIGVELDRDDSEWPPHDSQLQDLGRADNRAQRRVVEDAVKQLRPRPARIVARCSARRSPDRGVGRWLAMLGEIAPVEIELEQANRLADADRASRIEDWRLLASRYGFGFRLIG